MKENRLRSIQWSLNWDLMKTCNIVFFTSYLLGVFVTIRYKLCTIERKQSFMRAMLPNKHPPAKTAIQPNHSKTFCCTMVTNTKPCIQFAIFMLYTFSFISRSRSTGNAFTLWFKRDSDQILSFHKSLIISIRIRWPCRYLIMELFMVLRGSRPL